MRKYTGHKITSKITSTTTKDSGCAVQNFFQSCSLEPRTVTLSSGEADSNLLTKSKKYIFMTETT